MRRDVLQLGIHFLQLLVGFLQLLVVPARLRLEMAIVDEQDRGDRQHGQRNHGDGDRKPAVVRGGGAGAVGASGKAGCSHAGVVHSADGKSHHDRCAETGEPHLPGATLAQSEEQPQRNERGNHGDSARGQQQAGLVSDAGQDLNRAHSRVVHRADAEPHQDGASCQPPETDLWPARNGEGETGQADGDPERGERVRRVVGEGDRQ